MAMWISLSARGANATSTGSWPSSLTVPKGWPNYLSMGAISNIGPSDLSNGCKVDAVFTYDGDDGGGDQGLIVLPYKPYNLCRLSTGSPDSPGYTINRRGATGPIPVIVCYAAGFSLKNSTGMADVQDSDNLTKHLINLIVTSQVMNKFTATGVSPAFIMNPDCLGQVQKDSLNPKPAGLNQALARAIYYTQTPQQAFGGKTPFEAYCGSGTPPGRGTPEGTSWLTNAEAAYAALPPTVDASSLGKMAVPSFDDTFADWIQVQNWIVRKFSPNATLGWHLNISSDPNAPGGAWFNKGCWFSADDALANLKSFLDANQVFKGGKITPDFIVYDRSAYDDFNSSLWPGGEFFGYTNGLAYNCDGWNNYLDFVGRVSSYYSLPIMLWQIPGGHLVQTGEALTTDGSTSGTYFLGDKNLSLDSDGGNLAGFIKDPMTANPPGDAFPPSAFYYTTAYSPAPKSVPAWLLVGDDHDWSNGHLARVVQNGVFAILWGEGHTISLGPYPIDDKGWLKSHIPEKPTDYPLIPAK